jgi:peptidoglycan glycosyltransferase
VAGIVRDLMVDVVGYGTGTSAAIPGVKVAGKTGTAELEDTRGPKAQQQQQQQGVQGNAPPSNTDAWFAAFAPAERPRIAVGVMFVRAGAGGATAAPAARVVLATALGK